MSKKEVSHNIVGGRPLQCGSLILDLSPILATVWKRTPLTVKWNMALNERRVVVM